MDVLGGRPVWSMADSELLPALDALDAELIRLATARLQLIARVEETGYAQEVGARDCVELLSFRCRRDRAEAWRDVRLARALPRYPAVNTALTEGITLPADPDQQGEPDAPDRPHDAPDRPHDDPDAIHDDTDVADARRDDAYAEQTGDEHTDQVDAGEDAGGAERGDADGERGEADAVRGGDEGRVVRLMRPAHAMVIVSALERVRSRVAVEDLDVVEEQLVAMAAYMSPADLRSAAKQLCDLVDADGPEPEESKAYDRESLTLNTAEHGVKFRGYLANENAELLRSLVHAGSRPRKTIDGELDPRPRDKRQADALTAALTAAATAYDTGTPTPTSPRPAAAPDGAASGTPAFDGAASGAAASDGAAPAAAMFDGAVSGAAASDTAGAPASGTPASDNSGCGIAASSTAASGLAASGAAASDTAASSLADTAAPANTAAADAAPPGIVAPTPDTAAAGTAAHSATSAATPPVGTASSGAARERVPGFGAKANITVTIDLQDLRAATADAVGDLVYCDGLSAAAIRRLACDANVIPLVLGSNSEPLDVGRSERLVNRAMRRALNARDKGCVVCGAPPVMCDAHHLVHWVDGGETKVSNLVLLCRRHHVDLHAGRWSITITNGQVHVARPTWADPPPLRLPPTTPAFPPDPPDRQPASPGSPNEQPTRPDPWGEQPVCLGSPGEESTRPNPWGEHPVWLGSPGEESTRPDPWGEQSVWLGSSGGESARPDPWSEQSAWLGSSGEESTRPDPWGEQSAWLGSSGEQPASPDSMGGQRAGSDPWSDQCTGTGNRQAGASGPAVAETGVRPRRWRADDATYAEAARFALWGDTAPTDADADPPAVTAT